jgi:glycosyltransferase involved in cell wall biosynthesis
MLRISAVIITYNEENNIERCIRSLSGVVDEVVIVDSYSTDKTEEISLRLGARFIKNPFKGYRDQKNFATDQASYDYVLSLDADEALSIELKNSIMRVKNNWTHDGYKFNRLNNFCGQWIYHTSWYPDCKIRLFDRRKGAWGGANIHETVKMNTGASTGFLKGDLLQWSYSSIEQLTDKMNKYSTYSAEEYFKQGKKSSFMKTIISPTWHFFKSYILKLGFLDGYYGYFISVSIAKLSQLKYFKLNQLYISCNSTRSGLISQTPQLVSSGIRIGYDAKRAFFNKSGLGNYSRNLINSIMNTEPENSYFMFTPKLKKRIELTPSNEKKISIISPRIKIPFITGSLWRSRFMVNNMHKLKLDIYHGMSHELPFGIKKSGVKTVVTIHDLIFLRYPEFYGTINVFIYKKKMEYACKIADRIVAISSQTKDDIISFLNVDPDKIVVIYQGCNNEFQKPIDPAQFNNLKERMQLPGQYLLYVGTIEERKNLLGILKALKAKNIKIPLVALGRKRDYYYEVVVPYIKENNIENVIFPEVISNDELPSLYHNALCLLYPSFFEGFGIPILEAITSGIPVITSKGSCFEETGGEGTIYVDPYNADEIGNAIIKVTEDEELRRMMISKGKEHAKQFAPEKIAIQYLELYKSLL